MQAEQGVEETVDEFTAFIAAEVTNQEKVEMSADSKANAEKLMLRKQL